MISEIVLKLNGKKIANMQSVNLKQDYSRYYGQCINGYWKIATCQKVKLLNGYSTRSIMCKLKSKKATIEYTYGALNTIIKGTLQSMQITDNYIEEMSFDIISVISEEVK